MRLAAILFAALATASAITTDAFACKPAAGRPPRPEASTQHDENVDKWRQSLAAALAHDPDPEIAWTGFVLAIDDNAVDLPDDPPPVVSGLARRLQHVWCEEEGGCDAHLPAWVAAEPDNAFVLAIAATQDDAGTADDARMKLAYATRYEDYSASLRKLTARIAARYDTTPPDEPPGYQPPSCRLLPDDRLETLMNFIIVGPSMEPTDKMARDGSIDADTRLKLAERMLAAEGSPVAAFAGAKLGVSAAMLPIDRDRWCRLAARAEALEDSLGEVVFASNDATRALRIGFERALATRNALDALDTVAGRLPAGDRPAPPDEDGIAACIAGRPDDG